jgi:hypothetical protein
MAVNQGKRPSPRAQGEDLSASDSTEKTSSRKAPSLLVHVRMDEEMLERIDEFRFNNRFNDRGRAVRWLIKWALNNAGKSTKSSEPGKPSGPKTGGVR